MENEKIGKWVEQIHMENPDKGYRRINDDLRHNEHIYVNDKRILRICRVKGIKSTIKYNNHGCTRQAKNPQYCWRREFTTIKCREKRANYCRNITNQRRANRSQQPSSCFFTLLEWSAALLPEPCPFAVRRSPASFPGSFPRAV